jgi:hypothetical protein
MERNMTDKELLEAAARAAGIAIDHWRADMPMVNEAEYGANEYHAWNPLTDDGDALRLAVRLDIDIIHAFGTRTAVAEETAGYIAEGKDPYAATRRAIVQAAADIGSSNNATQTQNPD